MPLYIERTFDDNDGAVDFLRDNVASIAESLYGIHENATIRLEVKDGGVYVIAPDPAVDPDEGMNAPLETEGYPEPDAVGESTLDHQQTTDALKQAVDRAVTDLNEQLNDTSQSTSMSP